jgi:hypothetical protein
MKNIWKAIKNGVKEVFQKEKPTEYKENLRQDETLNKRYVSPGSEKMQQDVGKKVFEKTGHAGVGQSSTLEPQKSEGTKTAHGRKKYPKRVNYKNRKEGAGKMPKM